MLALIAQAEHDSGKETHDAAENTDRAGEIARRALEARNGKRRGQQAAKRNADRKAGTRTDHSGQRGNHHTHGKPLVIRTPRSDLCRGPAASPPIFVAREAASAGP